MSSHYTSKEKRFLKTFGERLRTLRKRAGFSQEGFALEINMDRTYVGGVERGERNIALLNLSKIADGLKVSLKELFDFEKK